ncbi:uncharacterized protein G2W53_017597 [Senna tora]|uniref:Uncharacterized protein n=1 Tax=Senna tora TaxID=362788 RepID=A0A834TQ95_9FABA|nr:uncharacterized protein G2W53_017597 [Senna tora]
MIVAPLIVFSSILVFLAIRLAVPSFCRIPSGWSSFAPPFLPSNEFLQFSPSYEFFNFIFQVDTLVVDFFGFAGGGNLSNSVVWTSSKM